MLSRTFRWKDSGCEKASRYVCDITPNEAPSPYVQETPLDVMCDLSVRVTPTAANAALLAGSQMENSQMDSQLGRRLSADWVLLPRKHITMSSRRYGSDSYDGRHCMDNINNQGNTCRTNYEDTPYLVVELEAADVVAGVRVYIYQLLPGTYTVHVADTLLDAAEGSVGNSTSCGSFTSPSQTPWEHLACPEGTSGRFVSIILPGDP